jgi:hypothetical protein
MPPLGGPSDDFPEQQAVREQWQMMSVLLERSDGDDDGQVAVQSFHVWPREVGELHGRRR